MARPYLALKKVSNEIKSENLQTFTCFFTYGSDTNTL
jgi:hypothetical protein